MLKTTKSNATPSAITISDVKARIATNAYKFVAGEIMAERLPREQSVKALRPVQDMLHSGIREAGHADMITETVNENLDIFLAEVKDA